MKQILIILLIAFSTVVNGQYYNKGKRKDTIINTSDTLIVKVTKTITCYKCSGTGRYTVYYTGPFGFIKYYKSWCYLCKGTGRREIFHYEHYSKNNKKD